VIKKSSSSLKNIIACTALALVTTGVMSIALVDQAHAQRSRNAPPPTEGRQFSSKAGEVVNAALQLINSNQHNAALSKLNEALGIQGLNPYERGTIYQMQGASYYELNQYQSAISAFENAVNSGGLLPNETDSLRVNIAQLLIANGQYADGAQRLENYLNRGGQQKPQYVEMLTQAWVQSDNYSRALPWAEKWFRGANPKERKHFDLLNFLYNNLGQPAKQADILTSEADLLKVVQYYSFYDMPFQAATILEQEMNSRRIQRSPEKLVQLSDLFRQAREYKRAIPILRDAASASGQGKLYATCRYESSQKEARPECKSTTAEQRKSTPRALKRNRSIEAFNKVPSSSREGRNAKKWVSFIGAEAQAVENRCEFELSTERELCYIKIKQAYDAEIFTGGFKLEDQNCTRFKDKYDSIYRVKVGEDG